MVFILFATLFLMACGRQANEISYLEEVAVHLERERQSLINSRDELIQNLLDLHDRIAELEEQLQAQATLRDKVLDSFMENLTLVSEFLGVDDLYIAEEDIILQGSFVTASSDSFGGGGIRLIFRYYVWQENISWVLLEYVIGPITGPGFLEADRHIRQWQQGELFDENFTIRFYSYEDIWPEPIRTYVEEEIEIGDWQNQVIEHMQTHKNIRIANLWYEGTRLVVDITPASAVPFNWGSFGGAIRIQSFISSLASMPNITEIEVLVGGQRGVSADHFSFAGIFRID